MPLESKQRGNFTVEFAMVGLGLSLIFIFSADVIIKLSIKGKLDRLSYSLVNVLKERTQLYDEDYLITNRESSEIFNIAQNSLRRTLGSYEDARFGAVIEELTFRDIGAPNTPVTYNYGSFTCPLSKRM